MIMVKYSPMMVWETSRTLTLRSARVAGHGSDDAFVVDACDGGGMDLTSGFSLGSFGAAYLRKRCIKVTGIRIFIRPTIGYRNTLCRVDKNIPCIPYIQGQKIHAFPV